MYACITGAGCATLTYAKCSTRFVTAAATDSSHDLKSISRNCLGFGRTRMRQAHELYDSICASNPLTKTCPVQRISRYRRASPRQLSL
jgi:hypothetical protein